MVEPQRSIKQTLVAADNKQAARTSGLATGEANLSNRLAEETIWSVRLIMRSLLLRNVTRKKDGGKR